MHYSRSDEQKLRAWPVLGPGKIPGPESYSVTNQPLEHSDPEPPLLSTLLSLLKEQFPILKRLGRAVDKNTKQSWIDIKSHHGHSQVKYTIYYIQHTITVTLNLPVHLANLCLSMWLLTPQLVMSRGNPGFKKGWPLPSKTLDPSQG